jgi:hypothetical protein
VPPEIPFRSGGFGEGSASVDGAFGSKGKASFTEIAGIPAVTRRGPRATTGTPPTGGDTTSFVSTVTASSKTARSRWAVSSGERVTAGLLGDATGLLGDATGLLVAPMGLLGDATGLLGDANGLLVAPMGLLGDANGLLGDVSGASGPRAKAAA